MKTTRIIAMLLMLAIFPMTLAAQKAVDAKRAAIKIPADYGNVDPEHYWEWRDNYYKRTSLIDHFSREQLDKIDHIEYKALGKLYELQGYEAYDKKIPDIETDVFTTVTKTSEGEGFGIWGLKLPKGLPRDTIHVVYVVEIDGTVGPIYMSKKAHPANKRAIVEAHRKLRFTSPAEYMGVPVRWVKAHCIITD